MEFAGKVVVITGGSSGIGLALAKEFAARDSFVVLVARNQDTLDQALASLPKNLGAGKAAFACDVSQPDQVERLLNQVIAQIGFPDALINSAGVVHPGLIQDLSLDQFQWMMDINYYGTVHTVKAVLPGMIERKSGLIVNIGSLISSIGLLGYSAYGASKFALRGFSEALRMEARPHGIRVSIVLPPDTDTPQLAYENQYKPLELKYLFPELGVLSPERVAQGILKGIEHRRFEIVPDFGSGLVLAVQRLTGPFFYTIEDWFHQRAIARIERESSQQLTKGD